MKNLLQFTWIAVFGIISNYGFSQCPTGQVSVELSVHTDDYGYEGYWEIVPSGNSCGVGTIASGGNTLVGCSGGAAQNQAAGGYGNNLTVNEGPWCLTEGASYDLIYVDDWGDGGFEFDVSVNGYSVESFDAITGSLLTFTFVANEPLAYDLGMHTLASPYLYDDAGSKTISGTYFNFGAITVTAVDINYQIDNDPVQTMALTGLNIQNFEAATFTHTIPWNAAIGSYILKVWASNINGNADMNVTNDILVSTIEIGEGTPNIIDFYINGTKTINMIANNQQSVNKPTDLDFHPTLSNKQLWVVNKGTENSGGNTVIIDQAGETNQSSILKKDANSWHFMSLPTGIAFGRNGNFGTSPGVFDANHNGGQPFTGPSLWSGDLSIYAEPSGGNGSHLDMLHVSPYSQGIASEKDNVYWVFDGFNNDIVRYDFVDDHGPGNGFHGDAIIHRYKDFSVAKDPNDKVPSHLVVSGEWVYVVDYGNQKVFRIKLNTGTFGATPNFGPFENVADYKYVTGYTTEDLVTTGLIEPTGIDVVDDRMLISDYSTGEIIIYNISTVPAAEMGRISTSAQGIMGIKIGPSGSIWYVDYDGNTVNEIITTGLSVKENVSLVNVNVYPNPTADNLFIDLPNNTNKSFIIKIYNAVGKEIYQTVGYDDLQISTQNWANGIYNVQVSSGSQFFVQKLIVQH